MAANPRAPAEEGRKTGDLALDPTLPVELEGALQSLYSNYEKKFKQWEQNRHGRETWTDATGVHRGVQQYECFARWSLIMWQAGRRALRNGTDRSCARQTAVVQQRRGWALVGCARIRS
ncbi:MAG: hypothetical protein MZV70_17565 [Desulfobacterales bacterium]|nr:hypothetical protein [Desulfobacterales bacterium]